MPRTPACTSSRPRAGRSTPSSRRTACRPRSAYVSRDGASIFYTANDRKPDSYAIYRYDVAARRAELIFGEDGLWGIADHRDDGRLLLSKATGNTSSEYFGYDPSTKALTPLLGQGETEDYDVNFGVAEGDLLVRTPKLGDFQRLYRYPTDTKQLIPITPDIAHDIAGLLRQPRQRPHPLHGQ